LAQVVNIDLTKRHRYKRQKDKKFHTSLSYKITLYYKYAIAKLYYLQSISAVAFYIIIISNAEHELGEKDSLEEDSLIMCLSTHTQPYPRGLLLSGALNAHPIELAASSEQVSFSFIIVL
jgi:hypothetical protein